MVISDLDHLDHQIAGTPGLQKAFAFLRSPDTYGLPDGRVEIETVKALFIIFDFT